MGQQSRLYEEWQLDNIIGAGGFGIVFKATNKLTDEIRAIKRIELPMGNEMQLEKFRREAKTHAKLNHPNITRYYSCWVETQDEDIIKECNLEYFRAFDGGVDESAVKEALGIDVDDGESQSMWSKLEKDGVPDTIRE